LRSLLDAAVITHRDPFACLQSVDGHLEDLHSFDRNS
jgi:hypothetical protein